MSKQKSIALKAHEGYKNLMKKNLLSYLKFKRMFMNMKNGVFNGKNKKYTNKLSCHNCGILDHFIKELYPIGIREGERKGIEQ